MPFLQFRYCADAKADNHNIVNGESTESRQTCPRIFETCSLEQNVSASDHATNPEESKQCTRKCNANCDPFGNKKRSNETSMSARDQSRKHIPGIPAHAKYAVI